MSDWPTPSDRPPKAHLLSIGRESVVGDHIIAIRNGITQAAWPAANRAIYVAMLVQEPTTVYQLALYNGVVAGNVDIGIYSWSGSGTSAPRLASAGVTAMAGELKAQLFDIADQKISPGIILLGAVASTITTATFSRVAPAIPTCRVGGVFQQTLAEAKLPETAALEAPATGYVPIMAAILKEKV